MNYADTGFLVSLYLSEVTSAEAISVASGLSQPISVSRLTRLEFENAMHRAVFRQRITSSEAASLLSDFRLDIAAGVCVEAGVDMEAMFREASILSAQHTPIHGTRTLDLLHVAAARLLGSRQFLTFDTRQRASAASLGMVVLPA